MTVMEALSPLTESKSEDTWDVSKTLAILISGKAGVGKTTFANYIWDYWKRNPPYNPFIVKLMPFAYGVKYVAFAMGWDGNKDQKGRRLLQNIGKVGREYNDTVWADHLLKRLERELVVYPDAIIVDDWRFPNEGAYIKNCGLFNVWTVRIFSPERESLKGTPEYNDISETSLPEEDWPYDFYERNLGTLDDLKKRAIEVAEMILEY